MLSAHNRVGSELWLVTWVMLLAAPSVWAQATSTINGRVLDQGDAVLPGVTVTATNANTGVVRTTVSNAEGVYSMPGLDSGVYSVRTELTGFATATRDGVTLGVNTTITIDFTLRLAGVEESLTVTGEAPLIEVTQSKVASSIEATELQNLPMITRNVSGLLALLPGAAPLAPVHRSKENVGSVSLGGAGGTRLIPTMDGAYNRDNRYGGPLMAFTTEGIEQFQLTTSQFTAADGRSAGAALTMVTKSGTNVLHGSAFLFARDKAMTAKDYFTARDNRAKAPFNRQQYGGSIGGPVMRNRVFFFGALEKVQENKSVPVPDALYNQLELLVSAERSGLLPRGLVNPNHPHAGPIPSRILMYTVKSNVQLSNNHSLMGRFAGQRDNRDHVVFNPRNDERDSENSTFRLWSGVVQHGWVVGNRGLNQITGQAAHNWRISDVISLTGEHYTRDFPRVPILPPSLAFPSVTTGNTGGGATADYWILELRDDFSLLAGTHALRFGGDFVALPNLGVLNADNHSPILTFFDDPSVILGNSNGRYPHGFQTPGILRSWDQANQLFADENNYGAKQIAAWFQDDWRVTPELTLNLGLRYDIDLNFFGQRHYANNATREVLANIGNPYSEWPKTPTKDISPRVGFAYDLFGDGRGVLRGGYGLYFDGTTGEWVSTYPHNHRPLESSAILTNTAIGVGELATFRFGVDPLPPAPSITDSLPRGADGNWMTSDLTDARSHQMHVGYAHSLAANTIVSVDYSHAEGRKEPGQFNINPIVNGVRVLAPAFTQAYGIPDVLSTVTIKHSDSKSRYDALTLKFQRRLSRATFQVHYTVAGAYAYGGSTGSRGGGAAPQDSFDPFAPGEWGPTGPDERHRVVAMGVFELPYGIQLSPVFQAASARPYNLTAGTDLNRDGTNNDRYIDPATGKQLSVNAGRGDPTVVMDLRATKFVPLGDDRQIGVFAEFFNLLNTANFGNSYTGNGRSAVFRQPTGFIPGIGYPRQIQLGARFLF